MSISSNTSVHYHEVDVPVMVNQFERCYCLKFGDTLDAQLNIFVQNVAQLERLALAIQSQIKELKGEN